MPRLWQSAVKMGETCASWALRRPRHNHSELFLQGQHPNGIPDSGVYDQTVRSTGLVLSISLASQRVEVDKMNAMSKGLFGRLERDWQKAILNNRSQDARPAQQATKSKQWLSWKIERDSFLGFLINHFRVLFGFQYVSAGREGIFKRVSLPVSAGNIHTHKALAQMGH